MLLHQFIAAVIWTVLLFHILFAQKHATQSGLDSEAGDSNALTTKSRRSHTSNFRSLIKFLVLKLDWLPPSKTQLVSLLIPVGPMTHMRAVCKYVKSGDTMSILPTVAGVVSLVALVGVPASLHMDL
jgi:hypothetical protein